MRALALPLVLTAGVLVFSGCGSAKKLQQAEIGAGAARAEQFQEINAAKAANPVLAIFPTLPGKTKCLIPGGGIVSRELHGSCETTIRRAENRHEPLQIVTFTERWKKPACPAGATCDNLSRYSWVVWVKPPTTINGKAVVLATHTRGAFPPQATD